MFAWDTTRNADGEAILIAVASLTSVGFLADRVGRGLDREANQLLGGDLLLRADQPWGATFHDEARRRGLEVVDTVLFTSMVSTDEEAQLAGVKVVESGGTLPQSPAPRAQASQQARPQQGTQPSGEPRRKLWGGQ